MLKPWHTLFQDRQDAGEQLAIRLAAERPHRPVVLALPRGGVPVAAEVARRLAAPLDVVLVRKLGAPRQPELAIGAVVDGAAPETVLNDAIVARLGIPPDVIADIARRELAVIEARRRAWLSDRKPPDLTGRTVIVVDDGIATGATMRAALIAVRRQNPAKLIAAAPVGPPEAIAELAPPADAVVLLETPTPFDAISLYYRDFTQVPDAEVGRLLKTFPPPSG
jgi:predicted phosphoribosyltransferase